MNFIILGDKFQKRMKSKGCIALIKLNNKPLIYHQYSAIKKSFPECKIVYISGFESKRLSSFIDKNKDSYKDLVLINNKEYTQYNYAYTLSLASEYMNQDCFVSFGDKILSRNLFSKFSQDNGSQIFIDSKKKNSLGCIIQDSVVENLSYDLNNYLMDIYYFSAEHAKILKSIIENKKYHNYFIFEIVNQFIHNNQNFKPYDIGTL